MESRLQKKAEKVTSKGVGAKPKKKKSPRKKKETIEPSPELPPKLADDEMPQPTNDEDTPGEEIDDVSEPDEAGELDEAGDAELVKEDFFAAWNEASLRAIQAAYIQIRQNINSKGKNVVIGDFMPEDYLVKDIGSGKKARPRVFSQIEDKEIAVAVLWGCSEILRKLENKERK